MTESAVLTLILPLFVLLFVALVVFRIRRRYDESAAQEDKQEGNPL